MSFKEHLAIIEHAWETDGVFGLLSVALFSAFSSDVRRHILQRDGYRCVICGAQGYLEASHIDHDKSKPRYNDPSNGRAMCPHCHWKDHVNRAGRNGLPKHQNDWAIKKIKERC